MSKLPKGGFRIRVDTILQIQVKIINTEKLKGTGIPRVGFGSHQCQLA